MNIDFSLSEHMSNGIDNIVKCIARASLKNPKESAFIMKYAQISLKARKKRNLYESKGQNIPPFLISSITNSCNLFCKGCYARANKSCNDGLDEAQLSAEKWEDIFKQAKELGVSFMLLAGGEPLLRMDVIKAAAQIKEIIFPIFTNGTFINDDYLELFNRNRNLIPIISIEGDMQKTDERRGKGVHDILINAMRDMRRKGIFFGSSITVTTKNIYEVTSKEFFANLCGMGCKALIFVEYVPVASETEELAPTDGERAILDQNLAKLGSEYKDVILLSFPGDEKLTGGCLSAGRGFFHISANGKAEPCPFSPYSDTNIKDCTLLEALDSPLFKKLKESEILLEEHSGGCLLFKKETEVLKMLGNRHMPSFR